jgi:ADP-ribose pyrophosphatase YjhB (NUDIX family)
MRRHDNQPDPGLWEIPAGEVDETDDNIEEAVRRIVHEETGLEVFAIEDELPSLLLSRSGERPFIIQINFRIRVSEEFSTRVMAYPNRYDYMDVAWLTQDELVDYGLRRPIAMEELIDEAFCCIDQDADDGSDGAYWGTI